jgi:hypothetical protein
MATKFIRVPATIPTALIKEAVQKYLKENDSSEPVDKTLGGTHHHEEDARDEKGRVARDTISYEEDKDKKGQLKRIIAKLEGSSSSAFRVAIDKLVRIQQLEDEVAVIAEQLKHEGLREKIHNLFGPAYEFETRVVSLANTYELVLSKQPKAAETTKWEAVFTDLYKILTPELQKQGDVIVAQYRTIQAPKPPSLKLNTVKTEGFAADVWTKIKANFGHFLASVKNWGHSFDKKIADIQGRAKAL